MKIGFDFDGMIVNKLPLIPKSLIEYLFKGGAQGLKYRFPKSKLEQFIRKLSHIYFFRPPLSKNIDYIKRLSKEGKHELFLVSARYSFLEKETYIWLEQRGLDNVFNEVILNLENKQPPQFKEEICIKIGIDKYYEDDPKIVEYLQKNVDKMETIYVTNDNNQSLRKLVDK